MPAIDLRSDTVTQPTDAMREAMARAAVGDDGYGEDPTVRRLEALAAERLGKDDAVFVPSGTMANLVAQLTHTGRGGEVLLEAMSHILRSEMGGVANLAGLFHRGLPGHDGAMDIDALREAIRSGLSPKRLGTALVCMETTHNAAGGMVLPLDHMAEVHAIAKRNAVPVHIDGSRIFNAATALRVQAPEIARYGDSVSICLSKGLSAPVGSLLSGSKAIVERARAFRKMVGGSMRQAGIIAAAGIIAIEQMTQRLGEDHATAQAIARRLAAIDPALADPTRVQTNIVMVDVTRSKRRAEDWLVDLKDRGVLANAFGPYVVRLVTHRHIVEADATRAAEIIAELWRSRVAAAVPSGAAASD